MRRLRQEWRDLIANMRHGGEVLLPNPRGKMKDAGHSGTEGLQRMVNVNCAFFEEFVLSFDLIQLLLQSQLLVR